MTEKDIEHLQEDYEREKNHISVPFAKILKQIEIFERGIPYLKLIRPCTKGDGIRIIDEEEYNELISEFQLAVDDDRITKFVPASGAASRMFKTLQSVLINLREVNRNKLEEAASKNDEDSKAVLEFIDNIQKFAFYTELKEVMSYDGLDFEILLKENNYTDILRYTLESVGLNYVNQPKGSIRFHSYKDGARTAFEEHLEEAVNYAMGVNNSAKIHFTISPEYRGLVNSIIKTALKKYKLRGIDINVSYSYQKPSTDTIAVSTDNKPFKDSEGNLVFRPAGHGALLENLNDIKGDIIFIKNIDNLVPDRLRDTTYLFKKILAGYLLSLQDKIFTYLRALETGEISPSTINHIKRFTETELLFQFDESFNGLKPKEKTKFLKEKLNRPIRVCGMVKDEGQAGGGPFWVEDEDGSVSLQIVEKAQINLDNNEQRKILEASTHFNPVDLVCGVRDYEGNPFNLLEYSNPNSGLITTKSKDGKELKALELPGLWNGAMAKWITVFVQVPRITFNPVKEVNDLLKKEHQPV